ncbi:uncharacterized protein [Aristolochia californica]|uniref:uncharacterized protein n=1 Tax=Aristolochia californica TaxID=171875 RepID=UPI0035DF9E95
MQPHNELLYGKTTSRSINYDEHKDAEKYRQQGYPLYDKLALVVGNSIATRTVSQTSVDMCTDVQYEEENSPLDMLMDVDLGRDTPSLFFSQNESTPDLSQSGNPSTSTRRKKRPEMFTDYTFMFLDTMKEIIAILRDAIKPKDGKVEENWFEALTEIPDLSKKLKFHTPRCVTVEMYDRSNWTISRYFNKVLNAIVKLQFDYIKQPLECIHSKVLNNPMFFPWNIFGTVGEYYLVDAGYANMPGFLAPYRGTRYHLQEFGDNLPRNNKEEDYNDKFELEDDNSGDELGGGGDEVPLVGINKDEDNDDLVDKDNL